LFRTQATLQLLIRSLADVLKPARSRSGWSKDGPGGPVPTRPATVSQNFWAAIGMEDKGATRSCERPSRLGRGRPAFGHSSVRTDGMLRCGNRERRQPYCTL